MTDTSTFINQGFSHAEKAIQYDKQACSNNQPEDFDNAKNSYLRAIDYYCTAMKYEKNDRIKSSLMQKVRAYVDRAEMMKEWLEKYEEKQKQIRENPPKKTSSGGTKNRQQGDKEDEEDDKLQKQLDSVILSEKPNVKWTDIAGLEMAKEALKEAVILPKRFPQVFTGDRKPWKGILLYGPPGTGKSYLAKAVATEADATFFSVSSSDLVSKWQGESEKLVKELFEKARKAGNAIIFIDEIDALVSSRSDSESESSRRIKNEFLVQMGGVGKNSDGVLLLGATNIPWQLDDAILRRMERRVYIPLPDTRARATMFKLHLGKTQHTLEKDDFDALAEKSDGYSGSDIKVVCRDAIMEPVRRLQNASHFKEIQVEEGGVTKTMLMPCSPGDDEGKEMNLMDIAGDELYVPKVTRRDFDVALTKTKPTVGKESLAKHVEFTNERGLSGV